MNERDTAHKRAIQFALSSDVAVVTTAWVVAEVADGMCKAPKKRAFLRLLRTLESNRYA
jgi:predicted nucleic acid-binding protein